MDLEYKSLPFEVKKSDSDNEFFYFEGFAAAYGNIDRHDDKILPGAFKESLTELDPVVKWLHREPIGISILNDERINGLYVKAKTPLSDDFVKGRVKPQVTIGSVRKLSIGFSATEYNYEKVEGRRWEVRNITKGKLYEYSLVDIPANPEASVTDFKGQHNNIVIFKQLISKALLDSKISQDDQDKIIKSANHYISTMDNDKAFMFEDVQDISSKESFNRFLKETGLFTKSAREHLAGCMIKQRNVDDDIKTMLLDNTDTITDLLTQLRG
jgi:HK97 family phage prohead protease